MTYILYFYHFIQRICHIQRRLSLHWKLVIHLVAIDDVIVFDGIDFGH